MFRASKQRRVRLEVRERSFDFLLLLWLVLVPLSSAGSQESPPSEDVEGATVEASRAPRVHALLVGCTEYPQLQRSMGKADYERRVRLEGPQNDVRLFREVLLGKLEAREEDLVSLVGWGDDPKTRPTLRNILSQLEALIRRVDPDDRVLLFFAGHGVQTPDRDGDEIDNLDEVFLPADASRFEGSRGRIPNALTDDEIGKRVRKLRARGALVWIVMDTCHSGTMVRGGDAGIRYRQIDPTLLGIPRASPRKKGARGTRRKRRSDWELTDLDGVVAFYAAQSFHKAPELPLPVESEAAQMHGLLSFMVCRALSKASDQMTFRELHAQVVGAYQSLPYDGTVPLAEGDLDREVGTQKRRGPTLLLRCDHEGLSLDSGRVGGIAEGTVVEVFVLGRPSEILGRAEVVRVDLVRSHCRVLDNADRDGENRLRDRIDNVQERVWGARVLEQPVGDYRIRLCIVTPDGVPLPISGLDASLRRSLEDRVQQFPLVEEPRHADWLLIHQPQTGGLWLRPTRSGASLSTFAVSPRRLDRELAKVFRSHNLRRIAGGGLVPDLDPGLEVRVWRVSPDPLKSAELLGPGDVFSPGDVGRITLRNQSRRIQDVTVLYVDAHHGIQALFPSGGRTARLTHKDTAEVELAEFRVHDRPLGTEHLLIVALPRKQTETVQDLSWLAQRSMSVRTRGGPSTASPFGDLLEAVAFGGEHTRGMSQFSRDLSPTMSILSWSTEWPSPAPPTSWLGSNPDKDVASPSALLREISPSLVPSSPKENGTIRMRGLDPSENSDSFPVDSGERAALAHSSEKTSSPDLLLIGGKGESPDRILFDLDDSGLKTDATSSSDLDAELAVFFEAERRLALYDTENDGHFDLLLIDEDSDPMAERVLRRTKGSAEWTERSPESEIWITTQHLRFLSPEGVHSCIEKLKILFPDRNQP